MTFTSHKYYYPKKSNSIPISIFIYNFACHRFHHLPIHIKSISVTDYSSKFVFSDLPSAFHLSCHLISHLTFHQSCQQIGINQQSPSSPPAVSWSFLHLCYAMPSSILTGLIATQKMGIAFTQCPSLLHIIFLDYLTFFVITSLTIL